MKENVKYPQDEEKNEYRYIDFAWLDEIAMGLTAGAKKHPGETWREIPAREHVARAIRHLSMHQAGDSSEPHLINASMRCMMAFAAATGRATMAERTEKNAPQVSITAEEMAMLTGGAEADSPSAEKACAVCGRMFVPSNRKTVKYCSVECYEEAGRRRDKNRRSKTSAAKASEGARRKESMAHLGELTRTAHEEGLSYGQYMAQKRMEKGEEA